MVYILGIDPPAKGREGTSCRLRPSRACRVLSHSAQQANALCLAKAASPVAPNIAG